MSNINQRIERFYNVFGLAIHHIIYLYTFHFSIASVHRDVKPQNILLMISPNGQVCIKLTDFDQSKNTTGQAGASVTTGGGGSQGWMSPELLNIIHHGAFNKLVSFVVFCQHCTFHYLLLFGLLDFYQAYMRVIMFQSYLYTILFPLVSTISFVCLHFEQPTT